MTTSSTTCRRHLDFHPGDATSLGIDVLRQALVDWHLNALSEDAVLVAAELLANAARHTPGVLSMDLDFDGSALRITVTDPSPAPPHVLPHRPDRPHGHGMYLIDQLAAAWGHRPHDRGKDVWADLTTTTPRHSGTERIG
ncbi:ATP-binding protein [Kitasatospora terrestris]|uniref:Histidine kinase/HSP90-like ATPase domain-containing protein n=1 Tax=Kitasatospora terrestris TaxID=258051 RepID=A0ABP9DB50_9ACTN